MLWHFSDLVILRYTYRSDPNNAYNDAAGLAVGHESLLSEAATDLDYV